MRQGNSARAMLGEVCGGLGFVLLCLCFLWSEHRDGRVVKDARAADFALLERPCRRYMRNTKDRPVWRISWLCATLVTVFAVVPFAASFGRSKLSLAQFCVLVFLASLFSAHGALSYYTWHVLCPHYTCSVCRVVEQAAGVAAR